MWDCDSVHQAVLCEEVLELLGVRPGGVYIDATAGGGGHARALLDRIGPSGSLLAMDRDAEAIRRLDRRFRDDSRCESVQGDFARLREVAARHGINEADGIVMDIGVSSDQLDAAARGFSFQKDGPLDMRMDRTAGHNAADIVRTYPEDALVDLLRRGGEQRYARRIARAVVRARAERRLETTLELAELVEKAVGGRRGRLHPATRTFQALRIEVNDELNALRAGLEGALALLREGGRVGVISFHSLEDRIVKHFFAAHAGKQVSLPEGGSRWVGEQPAVRLLTRKPIMASDEEQQRNPRSRSAKLRAAERRGKGQ